MIPMLDCDSVMRQLWDYLDDELTDDRMEAIRAHLAVCSRCMPQLEFEQSFLKAIAQARREHSDPESLAQKVRLSLRAQGFGVE